MTVGIGKRTESAEQMIVRYIWDHSLVSGDKLPSCQALADMLGLSSATVFRAVRQMQDRGILECRDKVGVFVRNAKTPGYFNYNIAILAEFSRENRYEMALSCGVLQTLAEYGARGVIFSRPLPHGKDWSADQDVIPCVSGLRECIEKGEIQGILTEIAISAEDWKYLKAHKIPCCYLGGFTYLAAPMSVTIDLEQMLTEAFKRAAELGLTHPAFFLPVLNTEKQVLKTALQYAETFPAFDRKKDCFLRFGQAGYRNMCDVLFARKPEDRPDVLICPDDEYAQRIYGYLVREHGTEYLPHPVVLGNAQILREHFPVPADFLGYRIPEIAGEGVRLILDTLKTGHLPENPVRLLPTTPDFISGMRDER